jgi:hypothetical protein
METLTEFDRYPDYCHIPLKVGWNGFHPVFYLSWKQFTRRDIVDLFGTGESGNVS